MQVTVRGKHFHIPDHVEERARLKLGKLDHYLPLLEKAAVEVDLAHERAKEPNERYVVHVTVSAPGIRLHAEERAAQPELAIDQAARVLAGQARRHKTRLYERNRSRSSKAAAPSPSRDGLAEEDEVELPGVASVERLPFKPMTAEEALDQMKLLGRDFFLFHDADLGQVALLYRRKSGDIGLIIPELS